MKLKRVEMRKTSKWEGPFNCHVCLTNHTLEYTTCVRTDVVTCYFIWCATTKWSVGFSFPCISTDVHLCYFDYVSFSLQNVFFVCTW